MRYRVRQFWRVLRVADASEADLALAREVLTSKQMGLFRIMHPAEKDHAIRVLKKLQARGEKDKDLLVAALLHDVGKSRYPLSIWERVMIVVMNRFFPERVKKWAEGNPRSWRRAFVVAAEHPIWGAQMAAESGASPLAVNLIWRHQEPPSTIPKTQEDLLLRTLQAADDGS